MSLQFDARVTLNEYDGSTKKKTADFDYTEEFMAAAREHLENIIVQVPIIKDQKIYVFTITNISPVL